MNVSKLPFIIIIMSLLALLSSSSFFLSSYLAKRINDNDFSENQFLYALKNHNVAALIVQEARAKQGSKNWMTLNRQLATTQSVAALKLAHWYQNSAKKKTDIADNLAAIMWFEQAIRLHSEEAIIGLAQLYFDQNKPGVAKNTLSLFLNKPTNGNLNEARLILTIKVAIHLGDVHLVEQLVESDTFKLFVSDKADSLRADLVNYSIIEASEIVASEIGQSTAIHKSYQRTEATAGCISSLQFFATTLAHLKHLELLIKSFKAEQPLAQHVCLPIPRYISTQLIDCSGNPQQAISCNESHWLNVIGKVNTRHVGLMLAKGGANVHLGMLYLDVEDDINVFSHEISHLLGFVDEYPLVKSHNKCQGSQQNYFAHNMVVLNNFYRGEQQALREKILSSVPWANQIKKSTPILQLVDNNLSKHSSSKVNVNQVKLAKKHLWRLGTPLKYKKQVGLHISESCVNAITPSYLSTSYSAYKPVSQRTQLRYYASDFPKEYLSMLAEKPSAFLMPSFHYNIALALFQQGKVEEAKLLLIQAALWEDDLVRKAVILQGRF